MRTVATACGTCDGTGITLGYAGIRGWLASDYFPVLCSCFAGKRFYPVGNAPRQYLFIAVTERVFASGKIISENNILTYQGFPLSMFFRPGETIEQTKTRLQECRNRLTPQPDED